MLNGEIIRSRLGQRSCDNILRILDLRGKRIQVVLGVEIEIYTVVTKSQHVCLATGGCVALGVGWPHIGRILADDIGQCTLIFAHLIVTHG